MAYAVDTGRIQQLGMDAGIELLPELYELFKTDAMEKLTILESASAQEDYETLGNAAHAMAGVAMSFGAELLEQKLRVIMQACREGRYEQAQTEMETIPILARASLRAIEIYIVNT